VEYNWSSGALEPTSESDFTNAICHMGVTALPWLINSLKANDSLLKRVVWHLPIGDERIERLNSLLLWQPAHVIRGNVVVAIGALGPQARPAISALLQALDRNDDVSELTVWTLPQLGPDAEPALLEALSRTTNFLRLEVASELGTFASQTTKAIAVMVEYLKDPNDFIRRQALNELRCFPEYASTIALPVVPLVNDPIVDVQNAAMGTLATFGASAKLAVPVLVQKLYSTTSLTNFLSSKLYAARALRRIDFAGAMAILSKDLASNDPAERSRAEEWISNLQNVGHDMTPSILNDLSVAGDDSWQGWATKHNWLDAALRASQVAEDPDELVPALMTGLSN